MPKKATKADVPSRSPRSKKTAALSKGGKRAADKNVPSSGKRGKWILLSLILCLLGTMATFYVWRQNDINRYFFERRGVVPGITVDQIPVPDAARWHALREEIEASRQALATRYRQTHSKDVKKAVIMESRKLLEEQLPELMRCWIGTAWDFNGTAKEPGGGKIACGYFVSTVLEGAGFRVQRISLAQQPSQHILRTFLPQDELKIRVDVLYKMYRAEVSRDRPGIYIVGLDTHVGFVVVPENRGTDFSFMHSSGAKPWRVVEENADQADVLQRSHYRVIGNITASDAVIRSWLHGEKFVTHR